MSNVNLIDRLTRDTELRESGEGKPTVCAMRITFDNPRRGGAPGDPTFVDLATFGAQAKACAAHRGKSNGRSRSTESSSPAEADLIGIDHS